MLRDDQVCQWLAMGQWFSPAPPVSSTNKTDRHDITEILLKVAFNTIILSLRPKNNMCVYCRMSKKSRVGRSALNFFCFFFKLSAKPEIVVPSSGIWFQYFIFEIYGKPSFVLWRVTQFFYLLCSQFRQKASGWINKTLLLIKQQKWLSEFCVKIDRVTSKN